MRRAAACYPVIPCRGEPISARTIRTSWVVRVACMTCWRRRAQRDRSCGIAEDLFGRVLELLTR